MNVGDLDENRRDWASSPIRVWVLSERSSSLSEGQTHVCAVLAHTQIHKSGDPGRSGWRVFGPRCQLLKSRALPRAQTLKYKNTL